MSANLKILQVSYDLNIGGLQRVVLDLTRTLRALGHETHVCSLRGEGPLVQELRNEGVRVFPLPHVRGQVDRFKALRIFSLLRRERYQVIHTHNTQSFLEGGLGALLARTPVRIHTDHNRPFPDRKLYMQLERVFSWTYHKVVGVSGPLLENLHKYEKISRSKLTVIPNGICTDVYAMDRSPEAKREARKRHGLEGFTHIFGLGARLEPLKGLSFMVDAMPAILARHPGAALVLAGPGKMREPLKAQAEKLGIGDKVRILDPFPQLAPFYQLLDTLVLPSLSEGMPLCILEAMYLGIPVIATRVGGIPEILADEATGLLVPPSDTAALESAARRLLDDPELAGRLARMARADFDRRFTAAVMAENYLRLYREGLAGNGHR